MDDKQKLTLAILTLQYYANYKNYSDTHKGSKPSYRSIQGDADIRPNAIYAGKRARDTLKALGVDISRFEIKDSWNYEE